MKISADKVREILGKNILADGFDPIHDLKASQGSWLVDQRTNTRFLDMFSMFASAAVGYNHPRILAAKNELGELALIKPTLSDVYNTHYAEFVKTFDELTIPDYLKHAFFIEGGSLAVENALKIAFDWKVRKNKIAGIDGEKGTQIIHFNQAFHGRSGYTLSLTNTSDPRKTMYFPKFDWPRIINPKLSFPLTEESIKETIIVEKKAVDQINMAIRENPHDIAAIIIEPIQGEGGDNHFRDEFFIKLREICDDNEILMIFDEVQTGIGITGKMWAHEHFSVNPDIMAFGKKTQVCGTLAGPRIDEVENNVFEESSRINSTFGGNLTDMWRFKVMLEIIRDENLIENARNLGEYLKKELEALENEFPAYVTNAHGLGLFAAFDLPSSTERDDLWLALNRNKLLILPCGDRSIRFRPHLNVTKEDLSEAISIVKKSITECLK
ncbi:MAG: L-lysine 6-transaminase [Candidatus Marinimicrobia bacterium]|jgi:L-lysine 6-transaminase|nr:L-lysine 6-transaminase [Candidatus Neomarinimicrobiota bacterium]MBT3634874.1 L-lysine 6-transaminase [Candidatus Neomarinimicrobiota bacterium]MBT3682764.1 L-lysine 6-transaminase [Candidatus Neomarinimicrobiota bacterium]MBT3759581.1 L-lysine 6-transaminase [Candidatus Neomarinimicrobiota bacterium]MBT3894547.1 L-lysine 6-transaminase [Candidatus Neomarinimicrobiota bacterium]